MAQQRLTPELISDPSLWRLAVELRQSSIEVVIMSMLHDNTLIRRSIALDSDIDYLSALTNAVYDNPLILGDFGKRDILLDIPKFTIVPAEIKDNSLREEMMRVLWPNGDYEVIADEIPHSDDILLSGVDTPLVSFVRRTFPTCRIMHRLSPVIRYFYNKNRLNSTSKMYVQLHTDRIDVLYIKNGHLAVVNTFKASEVSDMVYYILACAKTCGFDLNHEDMMLYGQQNVRDQIMPELRRYVEHVMPVLFPSTMLSMGTDALSAPFELIILPLCE